MARIWLIRPLIIIIITIIIIILKKFPSGPFEVIFVLTRATFEGMSRG